MAITQQYTKPNDRICNIEINLWYCNSQANNCFIA